MNHHEVAKAQGPIGSEPAARFAALYRLHVAKVYAFMHQYARNHFEAEDLTAEVFERALKYFRSYDPDKASPRTWLFAIVRNVVRAHANLRKQRAAEYLDSRDVETTGFFSQEEGLRDFELKQALSDAMGELPEREREIIVLKFAAGLSSGEIGQVVGLPEVNVRAILRRSLKRMARRLT